MNAAEIDLDRLRSNLLAVRSRMAEACVRSGRRVDSARLVAVTKQVPTECALALVRLGQADLGENYPQELWRKADALSPLPALWHLIGHLQTNKAKRTYPLVAFVHAVDSLKLLRLLDELAEAVDAPAPVCLQVNCSAEASKHGWEPAGILQDAHAIAACRRVPVVGLMTMAAMGTTPEQAQPAFAHLREIRDQLQARTGIPLPELSMGMSNDYEVAIAEGATWVRVGSAIFEGVGR
jgi:pyridoxal phosphate enzyme (YggS family)